MAIAEVHSGRLDEAATLLDKTRGNMEIFASFSTTAKSTP